MSTQNFPQPLADLTEGTRLVKFRRWLGIYNKAERLERGYQRRIAAIRNGVMLRRESLCGRRPVWMRNEDYHQLRALSSKLEKA